MLAGEFEPIVDVVTQRWRGSYDLYDAYAFGQVYAAIRAGKITITPIHLGSTPSGDDQITKNREKLTSLETPFKAIIREGKGDDDGSFSWVEPLYIGEVLLDPQDVPLEVGYTRPLTTLWHLHLERGLARWPYGHAQIWLLRASATVVPSLVQEPR
jgi:hypothetical protein